MNCITDKQCKAVFPAADMGTRCSSKIKASPKEMLSYRSSLRNKLVAEGFYLTNVIEKYGSGFIRIRRAMAEYPEVKFSIEEAQGGVWAVFELATLAVEQTETPQVTPQVQQLLDGLKGEMSRLELMESLQLSDRKNFSDNYLKPALAQGFIEMTRPETPNSRLQRYRRRGGCEPAFHDKPRNLAKTVTVE